MYGTYPLVIIIIIDNIYVAVLKFKNDMIVFAYVNCPQTLAITFQGIASESLVNSISSMLVAVSRAVWEIAGQSGAVPHVGCTQLLGDLFSSDAELLCVDPLHAQQ